jgi:hypothetical protein
MLTYPQKLRKALLYHKEYTTSDIFQTYLERLLVLSLDLLRLDGSIFILRFCIHIILIRH